MNGKVHGNLKLHVNYCSFWRAELASVAWVPGGVSAFWKTKKAVVILNIKRSLDLSRRTTFD